MKTRLSEASRENIGWVLLFLTGMTPITAGLLKAKMHKSEGRSKIWKALAKLKNKVLGPKKIPGKSQPSELEVGDNEAGADEAVGSSPRGSDAIEKVVRK